MNPVYAYKLQNNYSYRPSHDLGVGGGVIPIVTQKGYLFQAPIYKVGILRLIWSMQRSTQNCHLGIATCRFQTNMSFLECNSEFIFENGTS